MKQGYANATSHKVHPSDPEARPVWGKVVAVSSVLAVAVVSIGLFWPVSPVDVVKPLPKYTVRPDGGVKPQRLSPEPSPEGKNPAPATASAASNPAPVTVPEPVPGQPGSPSKAPAAEAAAKETAPNADLELNKAVTVPVTPPTSKASPPVALAPPPVVSTEGAAPQVSQQSAPRGGGESTRPSETREPQAPVVAASPVPAAVVRSNPAPALTSPVQPSVGVLNGDAVKAPPSPARQEVTQETRTVPVSLKPAQTVVPPEAELRKEAVKAPVKEQVSSVSVPKVDGNPFKGLQPSKKPPQLVQPADLGSVLKAMSPEKREHYLAYTNKQWQKWMANLSTRSADERESRIAPLAKPIREIMEQQMSAYESKVLCLTCIENPLDPICRALDPANSRAIVAKACEASANYLGAKAQPVTVVVKQMGLNLTEAVSHESDSKPVIVITELDRLRSRMDDANYVDALKRQGSGNRSGLQGGQRKTPALKQYPLPKAPATMPVPDDEEGCECECECQDESEPQPADGGC